MKATTVERIAPPTPRRPGQIWRWRLYVAGRTPRSLRAIANLERLCVSRLRGRHRITVIDLWEHPQRARRDQILAVPTVVRRAPKPWTRILGDLSEADLALAGMTLGKGR